MLDKKFTIVLKDDEIDITNYSSADEIRENVSALEELNDTELFNLIDFDDIDGVDSYFNDIDDILKYIEFCKSDEYIPNAAIDAALYLDISLDDIIDCYIGEYDSEEEFSKSACENLINLNDLPSFIIDCIDWQRVWDAYLRHDYNKHNGYYFGIF